MEKKAIRSTRLVTHLLEELIPKITISLSQNEMLKTYHHFSVLKKAVLDLRKIRPFDPAVNNLRTAYSTNEYDALLDFLRNEENTLEYLEKVNSVIANALSKGYISPDLKPSAELLLNFCVRLKAIFKTSKTNHSLSIFSNRYLGGSLYHLLKKQKEVFIKEKYRKFRKLCYEERELLDRLVRLAEELKILQRNDMHKLTKQEKIKKVLISVLIALLLTFGSLCSSIAVVSLDAGVPVDHMLREMKERVTDFTKSAEMEIYIQEKYGINIYGDFSNNDIQKIDMILKEYDVSILKLIGLNQIHISSDNLSMGFRGSRFHVLGFEGEDIFLGKRLKLFSGQIDKPTVDHEIGHLHHRYVRTHNPEFDAQWLKACGPYRDYNNVTVIGDKIVYNSNSHSQSQFGHVRPSGGTNINEDVAYFVEEAKNPAYSLFFVESDFNIYKAKLELLLNYRFITGNEYEMAIKTLEHAENQRNKLDAKH